MLQPVKNIDEYKRVKEALKERFEVFRGLKLNDLANNLYSESSLKCYSL